MTFEQWIAKVDRIIGSICGLSHMDLPDICYYDYFASGDSPAMAAADALENAGFPADY